jgi:hypothetical protein
MRLTRALLIVAGAAPLVGVSAVLVEEGNPAFFVDSGARRLLFVDA